MSRARVCNLCQQTVTGPCPNCKPKVEAMRQAVQRERDANRESAAKRGYGHKWRIEREVWLKREENRFCVYCAEKTPPRKTIANVIDHFIPHRGDKKLFWDRKNWRATCDSCHNAKTARGQ